LKQIHVAARENLCERVTFGFGFTFDWMKKWREFFEPNVLRSDAKLITFQRLSENRSVLNIWLTFSHAVCVSKLSQH